jgi:hypothetical protein
MNSWDKPLKPEMEKQVQELIEKSGFSRAFVLMAVHKALSEALEDCDLTATPEDIGARALVMLT